MAQINETTQGVLDQISEGFAQKGAYNLRQNGVSICHGDSEHIKIRKKEDKPGIDILIDGDTKGERVFIPVVVSFSMLIKRFEEIHKEKKESLILISHQERIIRMADKIMVIEDGEVKQYGSRDEVLPTLFTRESCGRCANGLEGGVC